MKNLKFSTWLLIAGVLLLVVSYFLRGREAEDSLYDTDTADTDDKGTDVTIKDSTDEAAGDKTSE